MLRSATLSDTSAFDSSLPFQQQQPVSTIAITADAITPLIRFISRFPFRFLRKQNSEHKTISPTPPIANAVPYRSRRHPLSNIPRRFSSRRARCRRGD